MNGFREMRKFGFKLGVKQRLYAQNTVAKDWQFCVQIHENNVIENRNM